MLETFNIANWDEPFDVDTQERALTSIELGKVIFLPQLSFHILPSETICLTNKFINPKTKNISYDANTGRLQGVICSKKDLLQFHQMMERYASYSTMLIKSLLPHYQEHLWQGRTSFRPVEIAGRSVASYRKDDTRLHVDAFPATPMRGKRILRVFTNVNPSQPRVWRLGAPFPKVVEYFHKKLKAPLPGYAGLLNALKITKGKRKKYDHYMLQLHNAMKADTEYQQKVPQEKMHFPAKSSWIVFTDQVSHAAISGQFGLEQTFYLPPESLARVENSPCYVLEKFLNKSML